MSYSEGDTPSVSPPTPITHEAARKAYNRMHDALYNNMPVPCLSIPPQPHDVDVILCDYISQQKALGLSGTLPSQPDWMPIETAPKTGEHVLVANFDSKFGFGECGGKKQSLWQDVAHYWPFAGEEGWYSSYGPDEPLHVTHWQPLRPEALPSQPGPSCTVCGLPMKRTWRCSCGNSPELTPALPGSRASEMTSPAKLMATIARLEAEVKDAKRDAESWKQELNMYRSAWLREIGGVIDRKSHEIDGFILRTRRIYEQSKKWIAHENGLLLKDPFHAVPEYPGVSSDPPKENS